MELTVSSKAYSLPAVLTAVKKQQVFADWRLKERSEVTTVLSFSRCAYSDSEEAQCVAKFRRQLDDEQIREKLEKDFGPVRDRLVAFAIDPIVSVQK